MPIQVSCSSCHKTMKIPDQFGGKRVKCPGCAQGLDVPPQTPPPRAASQNVATAAVVAPAQTVTCAACSTKLKSKPEWAGKTLKCPRCAKGIKIPTEQAPEATVEDDWIDITQAYVRPDSKKIAADGWGEELLDEQEVPEEMRDLIRQELTTNERLTWVGRPLMEVLMHRARRQRIVGILVFIGITAGMPVLAWFLFGIGVIGATISACLVLFMMLVFQAMAVYFMFAPSRTLKGAATRSCYMITNRRVLIHPGSGTQSRMSRDGTAASVAMNADAGGLISFSGFELLGLRRDEDKAFPGTGDLIFSRDLFDVPTGFAISAIGDLVALEKRIRDALIHPFIRKLLRGELSVKDGVGQVRDSAGKNTGELVPLDGKIHNFVRKGDERQRRTMQDAMDKLDAEQHERAEAELAEGEKILWLGEPEGRTKGRGLMGAMFKEATRVEPAYTLYAITNLRVLLWEKHSSRDKAAFGFGLPRQGPVSYYPSAILDADIEEDDRIPNGGGILFKQVKLTIVTRDKDGKESRQKELHCFGILRIPQVRAVAQVLYEALIQPCKRS